MIEQKTVLVLGAGASAHFGFPTGPALKDQICNTKVNSPQEIDILEYLGFKIEEIERFRASLLISGRPSVDAFLEHREDFLDIGKTAIAIALLPYETTSRLFSDWILKREKPELFQEGNWYDLLFGALADGVPFDEFDKNKLFIITFNYDRSLEHYLFTSLKHSYNKTDDECGEKLRKIEIIHVHGSLGRLGWQPCSPDSSWVPYDSVKKTTVIKESDISPAVVKLAVENIKIIHEDTADTPEFLRARDIILNTDRVFFLGFGFHPTNMKRLEMRKLFRRNQYLSKTYPKKYRPKKIEVKGTSQGLSKQRKEEIRYLHPDLTEGAHNLVPEDVYTFLHEHVSFG